MMLFSPSRKGFWDPALEAQYRAAINITGENNWPGDLVEITDEQHATFSAPPPAGHDLGAGVDGKPAWVAQAL